MTNISSTIDGFKHNKLIRAKCADFAEARKPTATQSCTLSSLQVFQTRMLMLI